MADDDSELYRAEAYGPSQGEFTHATLFGPLGQLQQGDIAVSPNMLSSYPMGSTWDVVDATGNVLRQGVRVADTSWKDAGHPNANTFELWNDQDLGHARLVPSGGSQLGVSYSKTIGAGPEPIGEEASQDYIDETTPREEESTKDILSPEGIAAQIKKQYPQYKDADGQTLYEKFTKKYEKPIDQMRALYPQYKDAGDAEFTEALRKKYYPQEDADDFRDRMNPPTGVQGATQNFLKELWPNMQKSWLGSMAQIASFPERVADADKWLAQNGGWIGKALEGNLQGQNPDPDNEFRDKIARLNQFAEEQKKNAQGVKVPQAQGMAGNVGSVVGQSIGSAPSTMMAFIPGAGPAASLIWGMTYEGLSVSADSKENKSSNSEVQGLMASGTRAIQQWILNTPRGRIVSGLWNAALGMGDEQAQKFISGNKDNDIDKTAATGAVDFFIGALMGHGIKNRYHEALGHPGQEKLLLPDIDKDYVDNLMRDNGTPMGGTPFPRKNIPKAASESIDKAFQAREAGDIPKALEYIDQAMLFLPDKQKAETGQLLLKWRDDVIPMGNSPEQLTLASTERKALPAPEPGRAIPMGGTIPSGPVIQRPYRTKEELRPLPRTTEKGHEAITDQFYSGFAAAPQMIGKIIEEGLPKVREFVEKHTPERVKSFLGGVQATFDPESLSPAHETAGAVIREQNARKAIDSQRMLPDWWGKQKLMDNLRFGYRTDRRMSFWKTFNNATLKTMLEHWESKESTGNSIADRLLKYYDAAYDAIGRMDQQHGLNYTLRDSYIPHILKDPKDIARVEDLVRRMRWGDPAFMKQRAFDNLRALHKFGFELKTYNPEELIQMRLDNSLRARAKVEALRKMADVGVAVPAKDLKGSPQEADIVKQSVDVRSPGGGHYWVHRDADFMLHRAWDVNPIYQHPAIGEPVKFLNELKQKTVGSILTWSGFHHLHMPDIAWASSIGTASRKFLESGGTGADFMKALTEAGKGTAESHKILVGVNKYNKIVDYYQGGKGVTFNDLSETEKQEVNLQMMGGLAPVLSHEREAQFIPFLNKIAGPNIRKIDRVLDVGYKIATAQPYQEFLFKRVIPSLKMHAFNEGAHALSDTKPELFKPENEGKLRVELGKIAKNVDNRFGEVFYDNMFWPKWLKTVGQTALLSLGWQNGFFRIYGEGLSSVMDNAVHMDEILKQWREEGAKPVAKRVLNNSTLYMFHYTAMTAAKNLLISQIFGGSVTGLLDAIYPKIGKNPDGTDKRVKTPFFLGEFGALYEYSKEHNPVNGILLLAQHKLQPAFATIGALMQNRDYRGVEIARRYDPLINQFGEQFGFILSQLAPISFQNVLRPKPGADNWDKVIGFLGLPPAPSWTGRSSTDNEIVSRYSESVAKHGKSKVAAERSDLYSQYRSALESKDTSHAMEVREQMVKAGISDKSIDNIENNLHETIGQVLLKQLEKDDQIGILKGMQPEERRKYLPYASKKVQEQLSHEHN